MDTITGLQPQTLYYMRTYITNSIGTAYGNEISFYTLSNEPPSHVTNFSATALSTTQINLSWTTTTSCSGYVVLQKQGSSPTGLPSNSQAYMVADAIGDASVAAVLSSGTSNSCSITGLTPGTAYSFTIFPYNFDGTNTDTYSYKTTTTIPFATATTQSLPDQGPAVIINEFSQGSGSAKEWVELLVTQNNFNLQNYKLTDSAGNLSLTLSGSGFSNLPQGHINCSL